jgi:hypothetical protein
MTASELLKILVSVIKLRWTLAKTLFQVLMLQTETFATGGTVKTVTLLAMIQ